MAAEHPAESAGGAVDRHMGALAYELVDEPHMIGMVMGQDDTLDGVHLYAVAAQLRDHGGVIHSGIYQEALLPVADVGAVA